jgi:RNA polymerase sigma-70 factor (ECF subfamily)
MTAAAPAAGAVSAGDAAVFEAARPRLLAIARRVLGNPSDAEDVVQETWLRWQGTDRRAVQDPPTFLATATLRLAINVTRSARVRRETHVDPSVAEPPDPAGDPAAGAERHAALADAIRVLLRTLTPGECAAYILREAFGYPHRRVAEALAVSEANARQLAGRARARLGEAHGRRVGAAEHRRLLQAFLAADGAGDLPALERLLAATARPRRRPAAARRELVAA